MPLKYGRYTAARPLSAAQRSVPFRNIHGSFPSALYVALISEPPGTLVHRS
jgi:hypothetical protein